MTKTLRGVGVVLLALLVGCDVSTNRHAKELQTTGLAGHLIIIGGAIEDDNKPVYERFIALASAPSTAARPPRILIAAAASADQAAGAASKTKALGLYSPTAVIDVITRETPTDQTVALIDQASAIFFTGGDQKRITDRYRPAGKITPELDAMTRLLARGGVIAGTSAGDAMMSDPMFLTGRSAEALGIASTRKSPDQDADPETPKGAKPVMGPQIGQGMGLIPWVITDSHFFERNRFGRLVAALEVSKRRLGLGVGENAAVEVNLATGQLVGLSVANALLVDVAGLSRDGLTRRGVRARVISQGTRLSLTDLLARPNPPASTFTTSAPPHEILPNEPGTKSEPASVRFFTKAAALGGGSWILKLDGYEQIGRPDDHTPGSRWSIIEIRPTPPN